MKKFIALISGLIILSLTGCTSITEVRDRAFIQAVGADGNNQQSVAIRTFGKEESEVCKGKGETVFSAIENAEASQEKNLFLGHIENLVISDGNIKDRIGILMKNNRITPSCNVVYSRGSAMGLVEDDDSIKILSTANSKARKSVIIQRSMSDVMKELMSADGTAIVPIINDDNMTMGVIDENGLRGTFSEEESTALCLLEGTAENNVIPLQVSNNKSIDFWIKKIKKTVHTDIENNRVVATITFKIEGEKVEADKSNIDVKRLLSDKIINMCDNTIKKGIQEFNSDTFGLETSLKKNHPQFYRENKQNWSDILKSTEIKYKIVSIHI